MPWDRRRAVERAKRDGEEVRRSLDEPRNAGRVFISMGSTPPLGRGHRHDSEGDVLLARYERKCALRFGRGLRVELLSLRLFALALR